VKLQEKMDAYKKEMQARAPREALDIMHQATETLRQSGILKSVVKPGDPAPSFRLENTSGDVISMGDLLSKGPLVVSFYRGKW